MIQEAQDSPNDSQFYCCFGRCHALKGAKIIAYIFTVYYVLIALFNLVALVQGYRIRLTLDTCVSLVGIIVVGCLWYGLIKERKGFLMPFLIFMILWVIVIGMALALLLVGVPYAIIRGSAFYEQKFNQMYHEKRGYEPVVNYLRQNPSKVFPVLMITLFGVTLSFALSMLIFCTVKKAYSYIKEIYWTDPNAATDMYVTVPMMEQGQAMEDDMYPPAYYYTYRKN
uniref:DUF7027 domain-containing protein n=1 Tax=Plectus sambesii TaxID=2011161 RepID=A0A914W5W7_9BILA